MLYHNAGWFIPSSKPLYAPVDLVVLGGEGLEEEGGEGGGGDVLGGEAEDVSDRFARIELGVLSKLEGRAALVGR